ncbi:hypothetical protein [Nocardia sp. NPDC052566]|uniref:hypothetical protein n=1 Tax=Nocardia sp. NPDC052566 TaxID=3364330 RepID=UPI0037CA8DA8
MDTMATAGTDRIDQFSCPCRLSRGGDPVDRYPQRMRRPPRNKKIGYLLNDSFTHRLPPAH